MYSIDCCPIEILMPVEVQGSITAFRLFYYRLSLTIRLPDLLAQELCARGVIDQSTVVSACVSLLLYLFFHVPLLVCHISVFSN